MNIFSGMSRFIAQAAQGAVSIVKRGDPSKTDASKLPQPVFTEETQAAIKSLQGRVIQSEGDSADLSGLLSGDLTEVERFSLAYEIEPGEVRNKFVDIYNMYCNWTKAPVSKVQFGRELSQKFKSARTGQGRYYLLDRKLQND